MKTATKPEDAVFRAIPQAAFPVRDFAWPVERVAYDAWTGTTIGPGGFRVFRIPRPAELKVPTDLDSLNTRLSRNAWMTFEVEAKEGELSVQGLARPGGKQPVKVWPASYDKILGRFVLRVPNFDAIGDIENKYEVGAEALVVVTRYSGGSASQNYRVHVSAVTPPAVRDVKVYQKKALKYHVGWADHPATGWPLTRIRTLVVDKGLDPTEGDAEVEITFAGWDGPALNADFAFNGKWTGLTLDRDGRTYRATIPKASLTRAKSRMQIAAIGTVPLDTNPATVAEPVANLWVKYEQAREGTVLELTGLDLKGKVGRTVQPNANGSLNDLRVDFPAFADVRGGKSTEQYLITSYLSCSEKGPFHSHETRPWTVARSSRARRTLSRDGSGPRRRTSSHSSRRPVTEPPLRRAE